MPQYTSLSQSLVDHVALRLRSCNTEVGNDLNESAAMTPAVVMSAPDEASEAVPMSPAMSVLHNLVSSIQSLESRFGPHHDAVIETHIRIGDCCVNLSRYVEADVYYNHALRAVEARDGEGSPMSLPLLRTLQKLYDVTERRQAERDIADKIESILRTTGRASVIAFRDDRHESEYSYQAPSTFADIGSVHKSLVDAVQEEEAKRATMARMVEERRVREFVTRGVQVDIVPAVNCDTLHDFLASRERLVESLEIDRDVSRHCRLGSVLGYLANKQQLRTTRELTSRVVDEDNAVDIRKGADILYRSESHTAAQQQANRLRATLSRLKLSLPDDPSREGADSNREVQRSYDAAESVKCHLAALIADLNGCC